MYRTVTRVTLPPTHYVYRWQNVRFTSIAPLVMTDVEQWLSDYSLWCD